MFCKFTTQDKSLVTCICIFLAYVCVCVCVCASLMLFGSVQADYKLVDTHLVHLCFEMLCDTQKLELEGALGMRLQLLIL